jgi:hypothetical protein
MESIQTVEGDAERLRDLVATEEDVARRELVAYVIIACCLDDLGTRASEGTHICLVRPNSAAIRGMHQIGAR